MAKTDKKEAPVFRNRSKIDQIVYDESYSTLTIPPGKTIKGDWYKRYAVARNSPFVLVKDGDKDTEDKQTKNVPPTGGSGDTGKGGGAGSEEGDKGGGGDEKGSPGGKGVDNDKDKGTTDNKGKK